MAQAPNDSIPTNDESAGAANPDIGAPLRQFTARQGQQQAAPAENDIGAPFRQWEAAQRAASQPARASKQTSSITSPLDTSYIDAVADREGLTPNQRIAMAAILGQESSNGKNARTSIDGARGPGQIMAGTFQQYAKPGESVDNPEHNLAVAARIVKGLGGKSGDDPAKIAVGYFSGPGNINLNEGQPWKADKADGNGKYVSSYVGDVLRRIGNAPSPAASAKQAAPEQTTAEPPTLTWQAFTSNPAYQQLPEDRKQVAHDLYFRRYIEPRLNPDQVPQYRALFDQRLAANRPSLLSRAGSAIGQSLADGSLAASESGQDIADLYQQAKLSTTPQEPSKPLAQRAVEFIQNNPALATDGQGVDGDALGQPMTPDQARRHADLGVMENVPAADPTRGSFADASARIRGAEGNAAKVNAAIEADKAAEAKRQSEIYSAKNIAGNLADNSRTAVASILKIGPTAAKGIADLGQLVSGAKVGKDSSDAMEHGMKVIDEMIASPRFNDQNGRFKEIMGNSSLGLGDMVAYLIDNPAIIADNGITTIGSMFLPAGVGGLAGKAASGASAVNKARIATAAAVGTSGLQNAADTFTNDEVAKMPMADRYKGAAASFAVSALAGWATGGGADGAVARKLAGEIQAGRASSSAASAFFKEIGKAAGHEGIQESGEEIGNALGEGIATGKEQGANNLAKRISFAGTLGAIIGGGTHMAMHTSPAEEIANAISEGVKATTFTGQGDAARAALDPNSGAIDPRQTRKPESAPAAAAAPSTPQEILAFSDARRQELEAKRDAGADDAIDGAHLLDDEENAELHAIEGARGKPEILAQLYGFDKQGRVDEQHAPGVPAGDGRGRSDSPATGNAAGDAAGVAGNAAPAAPEAGANPGAGPDAAVATGVPGADRAADQQPSLKEPAHVSEHPEVSKETAPSPSAPAAPQTQPEAARLTSLILPDGRKLNAQWEVVDADSVKASLKEGVAQPRDRGRAASNLQVTEIARNPDFERLSDTSKTMDHGAPTLSKDGLIVGGNGRFEGISQAYEGGAAGNYLAELKARAAQLGIDTASIEGMKKPVLVRRVVDAADTRELAIASNQTAGLQMSDMEQAALDAERMRNLDQVHVTDTGDIPLTTANMSTIRDGLKSYSTEELSGFIGSDGGLSQSGMRRVRNAILYKAYGKTETLTRLIESPDADMKNVGAALVRAAGKLSKVRDAIQSGAVPAAYDIVAELESAIATLSDIRSKNQNVDEYLQQQALFGDGISQETKVIIKTLADNLRSSNAIAGFLQKYADAVLSIESAADGLFGAQPLPTKQETLSNVVPAKSKQQQATLTEQPGQQPGPENREQSQGKAGPAEGNGAVRDEAAKPEIKPRTEQQARTQRKSGDGSQVNPDQVFYRHSTGDMRVAEGADFEPAYIDVIRSEVKRLSARWKNAPPIHVVQKARDLKFAAHRNTAGAFHRGEVWLVADNLRDEADAQFVLFHEVLGHAGLQGALGGQIGEVLRALELKNQNLREAATAWRSENASQRIDQNGNRLSDEQWRRLSIEEALADMAGTGQEISGLQRLFAVIQKALRAVGFDKVADWLEKSTNADLMGVLAQARRHIEKGPIVESQFAKPELALLSRPKDAVRNRPDVMLGVPLGGLSAHPDYLAAKSGDTDAAIRLVSEAVPAEFIDAVRTALGAQPAIIQPVAAIEATGQNRIPSMAAARIAAELGHTVGMDILQASSPKRTSLGGLDRIFRRPQFDGTVVPGARYFLLDDTLTQGGTLSALADYIERKGGQVVGMAALTGKQYSARIALSDQTLRTLREKYGDIEHEFQAATGYGFDALTESEARYLASFRPAESVRARILQEGQSARDRKGAEVLRQEVNPDSGDLPPDTTFHSLAAMHERSAASEQAADNTVDAADKVWAGPQSSRLDNIIYTLQDKHIDLRRVVRAIEATKKPLEDKFDAYLQEELYHGRASSRVEAFINAELNPLLQDAVKRHITLEDIDQYLHARHAKEANALIAERNPEIPDGGSGMTNQQADAYMAGLPAEKRAHLRAVAAKVDAIQDQTRHLYVSYGLESQAVVDGWADMFKHYIPLMREDHDGGMGIGQGFSIKGAETKHRTGSTSAVIDILANIALQREKVIVRGEKNRVAVALAGLAKLNPNADFWTFDKVPTEQVLNEGTGLVETRPVPMFKSRDNVVVAKIRDAKGNIQERAIVFNEKNERAMRMAKAIKNLDAPHLTGLLGVAAKGTRYFAAINTQYNPIFGVTNLTRDVLESALNLSSTPLKGKRLALMRNIGPALRHIGQATRAERKGGELDTEWGRLWEEFQKEGGITGFRDMYGTSGDRADAIRAAMDPTAWMEHTVGKFMTAGGMLKVPATKLQGGAKVIFDLLHDYNTTMENATRLSAYKVAREMGMSKQRAASVAKNLTVNFNRKGQSGSQIGGLYAFYNAAVQGTARMSQTLFTMQGGDVKTVRLSSTGKKIILGGIAWGAMQTVLLAAAGFDDDEPPEYVRERNIVIPIGGKKYISIPMPLGYHAIANIGRIPAEFALGGYKKPTEHALKLIAVLADAYNPIGSAGVSMQTLAPTVLDPLAALAENKDWTGKPIAKPSLDRMQPGYKQVKSIASVPAIAISEAVNYLSGGTEHVAGKYSPTPDQLDYLFGQLSGGVGRELSKGAQSITAAAKGEDVPPNKIPLVSRFYGNADNSASVSSKFYDNAMKLRQHEKEIRGRIDHEQPIDEYVDQNPEAEYAEMGRDYERQLSMLRKERKRLEAERAPTAEVKAANDEITEVMKQFNDLMKDASRKK